MHNIELIHIQPGKPAQNGYIERFNRTYQEEILDCYLFDSVFEMQAITDEWLDDYNQNWCHESLDDLPPIEFARRQRNGAASFHITQGERNGAASFHITQGE